VSVLKTAAASILLRNIKASKDLKSVTTMKKGAMVAQAV
jgi:hypothetical protein